MPDLVRRCKDMAERNGYGWWHVASNLDAFYRPLGIGFVQTHTLRHVAAALTLNGALDGYLYSSGQAPSGIGLGPSDEVATADPVLLPMLSPKSMTFLSATVGLTRREKMELIADLPEAQRRLDVCVAPVARRVGPGRVNCGECAKCVRALVHLDLLGKLDAFAGVFDLPRYRARQGWVRGQVAMRAAALRSRNDVEVMDLARAKGQAMTMSLAQYREAHVQRLRRWVRKQRRKFRATGRPT